MNDKINQSIPGLIPDIEKATFDAGFTMASDRLTGSLLRTLVATKHSGNILELGTGTGLSACWLLDGMDKNARLTTVDHDPRYVAIARKYLSNDERIVFHIQDGSEFLRTQVNQKFDMIFADTWPGKFWDLDLALALLNKGGLYVVDDMLPQKNWSIDHAPKVEALIKDLESRSGYATTKLSWSSGIMLVTKTD